jgi:DUF971 family protein
MNEIPRNVHLDKARHLQVTWSDGTETTFPLTFLRTSCPCAACREHRSAELKRPTGLTILPGNFTAESLRAVAVEPVGNYAIRIEWSDGHSSGIYSWQFLRELSELVRTGPGASGSEK